MAEALNVSAFGVGSRMQGTVVLSHNQMVNTEGKRNLTVFFFSLNYLLSEKDSCVFNAVQLHH